MQTNGASQRDSSGGAGKAERRNRDERRQVSRRTCDERVYRILLGECDHPHWVIDEHLVFSEPCGRCLPCRAKEALKTAGLSELIARDLSAATSRRNPRAAAGSGPAGNVVPFMKSA